MQHGDTGGHQRIAAVVEVAAAILHPIDRPCRHALGERKHVGAELGELRQRLDGLRCALNVNRVRTIVVILRQAVRLEERRLEIVERAVQLRLERPVACALDVALQAVKVVAGVEVVHPVILRIFTVPPAPVGQQARAAVLHRFRGERQVLRLSAISPRPRQHRGAEHARVVHRVLLEHVIADAGARQRALARQTADPPADAVGDVEIARVAERFERVEKRLADERRPHDDRFVLAVSGCTRLPPSACRA